MFTVNNKDTGTAGCSGVFIVSSKHVSHIVIVFLLLTLSKLGGDVVQRL